MRAGEGVGVPVFAALFAAGRLAAAFAPPFRALFRAPFGPLLALPDRPPFFWAIRLYLPLPEEPPGLRPRARLQPQARRQPRVRPQARRVHRVCPAPRPSRPPC